MFGSKIFSMFTGVGVLLVFASACIALFSLGIYFIQYFGSPIYPANGITLWVAYASTIGPMLQTVVSVATLVVAAWLGNELNSKLDKRRRCDEAAAKELQAADAKAREERRAKDETNRELTRLSEFMVNGDFYLNVTQPSWRIATDWFNLDGEKGDEFRAKLVCEFIELPMAAYSGWLGSTHVGGSDAASPDHQKYSDYMVLALWTRFWSHIVFLEEEKIITVNGVRSLFLEWYRWWAPFLIEYVCVVERLMEFRKQHLDNRESIRRIKRLNHEFFQLQKEELDPEVQKRVARVLEATKRLIEDKVGGNLTEPDAPWCYLKTE